MKAINEMNAGGARTTSAAPKERNTVRPDFMFGTWREDDPLHERRDRMIGRLMEVLAEQLPKMIPERGYSKGFTMFCDYPGTQNLAYLHVECDAKTETMRNLMTHIVREGTCMNAKHYIMTGTREEIIDWLTDWNHHSELMDSFETLNEKVNDVCD
ncbi:MAG: hypothetical protein IJE08_13065 [Clostridia bacterium]|nr:hypothetical protein [Clostridia bacterium]